MARPLPPDDDGRTIVKMNVDGMPWYTGGFTAPEEEGSSEKPEMSREERKGYVFAAIRAGLLIWLVFAVVFGIVLLLADCFWLR